MKYVKPEIQNRINATALAGLASAMHRQACSIPRIPRCPFHDEAKAIKNAEYMLPHYERDMEFFAPKLSERNSLIVTAEMESSLFPIVGEMSATLETS